jgi:hypothetical protein
MQNVQLEPLGWSLAVWSARQFVMTTAAGLDTPASAATTSKRQEIVLQAMRTAPSSVLA